MPSVPDRPRVLVVDESVLLRRAVAQVLAALRPRWIVASVAPEQLDDLLAFCPPPVVVCFEPTTAIQRRARTWAVLQPGGANAALVGHGDTWRVVAPYNHEAVVDALDAELLRTFPLQPVELPDATGVLPSD